MKEQAKKGYTHAAQRRMIVEMINDSFRLAANLGRHPLMKGCNCIVCISKRKRILEKSGKDWKFRL